MKVHSVGNAGMSGVVIAVALCASCGSDPAASNPCSPEPNGCGPDGVLGLVIPECPLGVVCFTAACDGHDLCYVDCTRGFADCNAEFHADLLQTCGGASDRQLCENLAYIYWQATERFGGGFRSRCCPAEFPRTDSHVRMSPARLCPFVDADDDLLPDAWELGNGLDPHDPADALLDVDNDGLTGLEEYLHGSDPRIANASADG